MSKEPFKLEHKPNLKQYLPPVINEYLEPNVIMESEEPEFTLLWQNAEDPLNNITPILANESGIRTYESWLGIDSNKALTIEQRRANVLAKLNERTPFTWIKLHKMLGTIVGWDNFELTRVGARVVCKVFVPQLVTTVNSLFERIIPMNLYWVVVGKPVKEMGLNIDTGCIHRMTTRLITKPILYQRYDNNSFVAVGSVLKQKVITKQEI